MIGKYIMRYYWKFWYGLLLVLTFSCGKLDEKLILQELQQAEYSRKADPQKFIRWFNHKNRLIRLKAVETLGKIQDTTQAVLLANRLTDEDPGVRAAAAFALGQLFSPVAENYLTDALQVETDKSIRLKIIDAYGKTGTGKNLNPLRDFSDSGDKDYLKSFALAYGMLAYRGYPPLQLYSSMERLLLLTDDPELSWRLAYAVHRIRGLGTFEFLAKSLEKEDPRARYFALRGLVDIDALMKSPEFTPLKTQPNYRELWNKYQSRNFRQQIIAQLQDSTWYVRIAALDLAGKMGDANFQGEIIKLLDDPHPNVRIQAIRSLANYKDWSTRREMRRLYQESPDWRIRGEALTVLALIQPEEALKIVKDDLLPRPWPQNYYAIKTLENIDTFGQQKPPKETDEATTLLMQLARGNLPAQKTLAIEALVNRSKPPSLEFFLEALKSGDLAIATIVSNYLALAKSPLTVLAVQPLIETYRKFSAPRDLEAMEPIIVALDSIGSEEALPFLREELRNPYPEIREKARRAIQHITGNKAVEMPPVQTAYAVRWDFPPLSPDSLYQVTFRTSAGEFTIELNPEKAPINTANIVSLVKQNFYNGISFHRVVPGFVVQVGDPRGDGWGGPGYSVLCEYNDLPYERGTVGMALAGKDTGGSQFFVTHTPQPHLNGRYTVIGQVISGMETIDRLMIFDRIEQATLFVRAKTQPLAARR